MFGRNKQRLIEVGRVDQRQAGRVRDRKHESVTEVCNGKQG